MNTFLKRINELPTKTNQLHRVQNAIRMDRILLETRKLRQWPKSNLH